MYILYCIWNDLDTQHKLNIIRIYHFSHLLVVVWLAYVVSFGRLFSGVWQAYVAGFCLAFVGGLWLA